VKAGLHNYAATGGEGQGAFAWIASDYTSGCPFVKGTAFPVVTLPSWKAKKGVVTDVDGNDTAGTAKVSYKNGGDYVVTLTLANSLGSDVRSFQVIKIDGTSSVESVAGADIATYVVDGAAFVEFAQEGNYNVSLYTVAGEAVAAKSATVAAGDKMQIAIAAKGTFVLAIEKDGKLVRSVKLLNR
jgi:hypothetical protein